MSTTAMNTGDRHSEEEVPLGMNPGGLTAIAGAASDIPGSRAGP